MKKGVNLLLEQKNQAVLIHKYFQKEINFWEHHWTINKSQNLRKIRKNVMHH